MSKVSIIVPVYNPPEEYLKECINSIINQTFQDTEIILIDNASTGNNPSILKEYEKKDPRIKLIIFEKNKGFAGAVNEALKVINGQYIAIVDSDDWLDRKAIEKLFNRAQKFNLDLILFCASIYDEKKEKFVNSDYYQYSNIPIKYDNTWFTFQELPMEILLSPSQAWNKFYKKDLILKNGNFLDETLSNICVDSLFSYYNYINAEKIGIVRERLYNYRTNLSGGVVNSLASKNSKLYTKPINFAHKIDKLIFSNKLTEKEIMAFIKANFYQLFYFFEFINDKNKSIYYSKLKDYFQNLNLSIYSPNRMSLLEKHLHKKIKFIQKYSYLLYKIKNFVYYSSITNDVIRRYIFGIYVYKKKYANFKIYRRYLGLFTITQEDFDARMHYIIRKTSNEIINYLEDSIQK